jgi:altronate dehydratase large subunit
MGTPLGSPIAPVVKVTANEETFRRMQDDIDILIPYGEIFSKRKSIKEMALEAFFPYILDVISGKTLTKAEENRQYDFQIREMWLKI